MATTMIASGRRPANAAQATPERAKIERADWINAGILTALCLAAAYLRWTKLNSLVREDPAMWLFQGARAAWGEAPYRDFSWNYPPLAILSLGWTLRLFGVTFATAQAFVDVLSAAVVLLSFAVARWLLPRTLHLPVIALLIAVGVTGQVKFALFSFLTYSLALHFGAIGLLLLVWGCLRSTRPQLRQSDLWILTCGLAISLLSKPESMLAGPLTLALFCLARRQILWSVWIAGCIPAALAYLWLAYWVGPQNLKDGMLGYGLAQFACPWWPTGLGLFGAAAALGQAAAIVALFLWICGRPSRRFMLASLPGVVLYAAYSLYLEHDLLLSGKTISAKLAEFLPSLLWTSPVLLPVMWASCGLWAYRLARGKIGTPYLLLLTPAVIMSVRGLFGTTLYPYSEVPAICYPFFVLIGPVLLWRLGEKYLAQKSPARVLTALCLLYSLIRIAGAYPSLLSGSHYQPLETLAGRLLLYQNDGSAEIYRFLQQHTGSSEQLLDISYGGGVNFAAHRRSPAFETQYVQLRTPERLQQRDLAQVMQNPPALVIANQEVDFGTSYGYLGYMDCPCPRLVWQPTDRSWKAGFVFPLVRYLQTNYHPVQEIHHKVLLAPN